MEDLLAAVLKDGRIGPLEFNGTSIRIEHNHWEKKGGRESLKGCIVPSSTESLSDLLRRHEDDLETLLR